MHQVERKADILIECSWEVCNKVGGIYTVVTSKAAQVLSHYKEGYFLIGPYFPQKIPGQFQEEAMPDHIKEALCPLESQGIRCHYGKWLIQGEPQAILLDTEGMRHRLNDIKKELWDRFQVDSLNAGSDYDDPVLWSYASGMVIEALANSFQGKRVAAQFHEWLSAAGLLYLQGHCPQVGTVFTTHATVLGRALANSAVDLYDQLDSLNPDEEARKHNTIPKHTIEKAAAHTADVFTTVSEITGIEAEHLLGKKPDILLPNGLDLSKFPIFEELLLKHKNHRDKIREFLMAYFFPYYGFDLTQSLLYFLVGRYEYRAKGIDITIRALGILNKLLREENAKKTVIVFIFVPAGIRNIKPEIIENKTYFNDIRETLEESKSEIEQNILYGLAQEKKITQDQLFTKEFLSEVHKKVARFKKEGLPPLCTHDLQDGNDAISQALHQEGLHNRKEDRVKVIHYPIYLDGADGLLDLAYYESMQGCHLGIFPSYYEPWGYTPLEAGALGVPSVTTDLSGFGRFLEKQDRAGGHPGIYLLKRFQKSDEEAVSQLVDFMHCFSNLSREERVKDKVESRRLAGTVDWSLLVQHYLDAQNLAIEKAEK